MKKIQSNILPPTARITFSVLIFGFLFIFALGVFVLSGMRQVLDTAPHQQWVAMQTMQLFHFVDRNRQPENIQNSLGPFVNVKVADLPKKNAKQILQPNPLQIMNSFGKKPGSQFLALKLHNDKWLNIQIPLYPKFYWLHLTGFILMLALLIFCLILLCWWAVNRLSFPLTKLSQSMNNLGLEENILMNTGNRDVDNIITAFNQLQTRINKLMRIRTQMLAAISHDLRTPITRLKLRIEYLADSQYQKALKDLDEMENMIHSILAYTREDTHKGQIEQFDLNALLESLSNDFSDAGFKVLYQGSNQPVPFYGNISTLKRAFSNLIDNAIKYGHSATVQLQSHQRHIAIQMDDVGSGIPPERLEQVFDPFYRVEQSRSRETGGVGLGLTIARDTILAHHGEIQLLNLSQGGLRVIITLPSSPIKLQHFV